MPNSLYAARVLVHHKCRVTKVLGLRGLETGQTGRREVQASMNPAAGFPISVRIIGGDRARESFVWLMPGCEIGLCTVNFGNIV